MKQLKSLLIFGVMVFTPLPVYAGDATAGETKSAVCTTCHGKDGNSTVATYPVLAGQVPGYIKDQLQKFKDGRRADPLMTSFALALSEEDMADLDAFYSTRPSALHTIKPDQVEFAKKGEAIYRGGFKDLEIPPCMACHGPAGHGIPPRFPRVSGQHPEYLEKQLNLFKSGERKDEIMQYTSFRLTAEQIKQLALYMSSID